MEPTVHLRRPINGYGVKGDCRAGPRERLGGRRLGEDTVESDLRTIARKRHAP